MRIDHITSHCVRDTLEALRSNASLDDAPLIGLRILRRRLESDGLEASETAAQWALGQLLAELIESALIEARAMPPAVDAQERDPEALLAADFTGGQELREAWSALYYRYIAPERYQVKELLAITGHSASHLRRRRILGFEMLAEAIRVREMKAGSETGTQRSPFARAELETQGPGRGRSLDQLGSALLQSLRERGRLIPITDRKAERLAHRPATSLETHRLSRIVAWSRPRNPIHRSFVPLPMTLQLDFGAEETGGRWQPADRRFDDLGLALRELDAPAAVLLGPPGSGKSTLLGRLEHELALSGLRSEDDRDIPLTLYARLNGFTPSLGSPADWLRAIWQRRNPGLPSLDALLEEGRMVLLLDGLNEMPHASPREYWTLCHAWRACIAEFADRSPENSLVFSCRSLDYSAPLSTPRRQVPQLSIEPLDRARAHDLLAAWTGQSMERIESASRALAAPELQSSPFFLRLLADHLSESDSSGIEGRALLLSRFVSRSLRREVLRYNPRFAPGPLMPAHDLRRILQGPPRHEPLGAEEASPLIETLTRLAYGLQSGLEGDHRTRQRLPRSDASNLLPELGEEALDAGLDLGFLEESEEDGSIGFMHQLLQEFFVARRLARRPEPERVATPWRTGEVEPDLQATLERTPPGESFPELPRSPWQESTLIAAELVPQADDCVALMADANLALAGRAARRVGRRLSVGARAAIRDALLARAEDPEADLRARIDAARALGRLGDPRFPRREGPEGPYLEPPLVSIPGGSYRLGDASIEGSGPVHELSIEPFQIGRFAVTNAEYAHFVDSGGYDDGRWWDTPAARA